MKLAIIGGGGVRAPLLAYAVLRRAHRLGLQELWLMDNDPQRLAIFGELCRAIVREAGEPFRLITTTDARAALSGARHVITTIRVGLEPGRALDERIALRHGVLGQETTGPGGFAMAMRSIPALLDYARLLQEVSPGAWMYNFTNPAGLVAQALQEAGFRRTVGICDGANGGQEAAAAWLRVPRHELRAEVFGLNHLSWTRRIWHHAQDVLPSLLADPAFVSARQNVFEPELVANSGMFLNEYLYYYYYAEQALAAINADAKTRGEELVDLNRKLIAQLETIGVTRDPGAALRAFFAYEQRRGATYMHYAHRGAPSLEEADQQAVAQAAVPAEAGEGYAGVALDIVEALETGDPLYLALNWPNTGAISGMADEDVVEVSCRVADDGIQPLSIGATPPPQLNLMRAVKFYERLAVRAIRTRSRRTAIEALMAHPLVISYSRAKALVNDYLLAHAPYVGEWA